MPSLKVLFILGMLTLSVIILSFLVIDTYDPNKLLGYLPILIAAYCTESSISRTYNLYVKYKEDKQN